MQLGKELIKDGRHVGLDFYDLLIEALIDPIDRSFECNHDFVNNVPRPYEEVLRILSLRRVLS